MREKMKKLRIWLGIEPLEHKVVQEIAPAPTRAQIEPPKAVTPRHGGGRPTGLPGPVRAAVKKGTFATIFEEMVAERGGLNYRSDLRRPDLRRTDVVLEHTPKES